MSLRNFFSTVLVSVCMASQAFAQDALQMEFQSPSQPYRPVMIWQWMDGLVSKEGITADLEAYSQAGIGGVQNFQIGGDVQCLARDTTKAIGTEAWKELMRHAIAECSRLGLTFGTHNAPGWSASGYSAVQPQYSMQKLVWADTVVQSPQSLVLRQPVVDPTYSYYQDIAVLAFPQAARVDTASIIDLTERMKADGSLQWPEEGSWIIRRIGHTTNGKTNYATAHTGGVGLECDKMSREALLAFWQTYPAMLFDLAGQELGKTFKRIEIDSYEAGSQDWTPRMPIEFSQRNHYNLTPWLLALTGEIVADTLATNRFLSDWHETLTDLVAQNYYKYMEELISAIPGLELLTEPYATGAHNIIDTRKILQQTNNPIAVEFWTHPLSWGWPQVPSQVHEARASGRNQIWAEGFTCWPLDAWHDDPASLRIIADRAFAEGINALMLHAAATNPWPNVKPGMTFGQWGTQFTPGLTWWRAGARPLFDYMARCQVLLQYGKYTGCWRHGDAAVSLQHDSIQWQHRVCEGQHVLFLYNAGADTAAFSLQLAAAGLLPEIWRAEDGTIHPCPDWRSDGQSTTLNVKLLPHASTFVVLRTATISRGSQASATDVKCRKVQTLEGPWSIHFPAGWGAPDTIVLDQLTSLHQHPSEGVRYFSGTATYSKTFVMPKLKRKGRYILKLGRVCNLAEVVINGHSLPVLWKEPFEVDVTDYLVRGTNRLQIDVTNLWVNRLVGDEHEWDDIEWNDPEFYTFAPGKPRVGSFMKQVPDWLRTGQPRPNPKRYTVTSFKHFTDQTPLLPSGLIGPVSIDLVQ